jgi:hypothetical protein
MPKISSYTTTAPALTDKLIGTDTNDNSATKNFTVESIRDLVSFTKELKVLDSSEITAQELAAPNTKTQVSFGSATSNTNVSLNANGDITILSAGSYRFNLRLNSGIISIPPVDSHIDFFYSVEKNDTQVETTVQNTVYFDASDANAAQTLTFDQLSICAVGDVFRFYQAASLWNSGFRSALVSTPVATVGMSNVPSANIVVNKV